MRLWSIHPSYLDRQWLLAVWREGLLAQKVLRNLTKGYKNHPQLLRFRENPDPIGAIGYYLSEIVVEARIRGYAFDISKIEKLHTNPHRIPVMRWQLQYEIEHLLRKLLIRDPERTGLLEKLPTITHPLFFPIDGDIEKWEII